MTRIRNRIALAAFGMVTLCGSVQPVAAQTKPIRLGWQTPWATQGQLVMGLLHSNIQDLTEVKLELVGFSYGASLNQAALASQVDVLLTADQPAIALLARSRNYRIVGRMMYNRTCIYVPPSSRITSLDGIGRAQIGGPVGAAAERVALSALSQAGLDLASITFGNIDMSQQTALIVAGVRNGKWGPYDALYGFDPMPAVFEIEGVARMLHCGNVVSVIVASTDMIDNRRAELQRFLTAFQLSWLLFAQNVTALHNLFAEHSQLGFSVKALNVAASVEPNMSASSIDQVRLGFTQADFQMFDQAAEFLQKRGIIQEKLDIRDNAHLNLEPLEAVLASSRARDLASAIRLKR